MVTANTQNGGIPLCSPGEGFEQLYGYGYYIDPTDKSI